MSLLQSDPVEGGCVVRRSSQARLLAHSRALLSEFARLVCDIISLVRLSAVSTSSTNAHPDQLWRGLLIASLVGRSIIFCLSCTVLLWCRYARRPSVFAKTLFLAALLSFLLHIVLSCLNFILIMLWRSSPLLGRSVRQRCEWGIDVLWKVGTSGNVCASTSLSPEKSDVGSQVAWIVASCIRLIVVAILGVSGVKGRGRNEIPGRASSRIETLTL